MTNFLQCLTGFLLLLVEKSFSQQLNSVGQGIAVNNPGELGLVSPQQQPQTASPPPPLLYQYNPYLPWQNPYLQHPYTAASVYNPYLAQQVNTQPPLNLFSNNPFQPPNQFGGIPQQQPQLPSYAHLIANNPYQMRGVLDHHAEGTLQEIPFNELYHEGYAGTPIIGGEDPWSTNEKQHIYHHSTTTTPAPTPPPSTTPNTPPTFRTFQGKDHRVRTYKSLVRIPRKREREFQKQEQQPEKSSTLAPPPEKRTASPRPTRRAVSITTEEYHPTTTQRPTRYITPTPQKPVSSGFKATPYPKYLRYTTPSAAYKKVRGLKNQTRREPPTRLPKRGKSLSSASTTNSPKVPENFEVQHESPVTHPHYPDPYNPNGVYYTPYQYQHYPYLSPFGPSTDDYTHLMHMSQLYANHPEELYDHNKDLQQPLLILPETTGRQEYGHNFLANEAVYSTASEEYLESVIPSYKNPQQHQQNIEEEKSQEEHYFQHAEHEDRQQKHRRHRHQERQQIKQAIDEEVRGHRRPIVITPPPSFFPDRSKYHSSHKQQQNHHHQESDAQHELPPVPTYYTHPTTTRDTDYIDQQEFQTKDYENQNLLSQREQEQLYRYHQLSQNIPVFFQPAHDNNDHQDFYPSERDQLAHNLHQYSAAYQYQDTIPTVVNRTHTPQPPRYYGKSLAKGTDSSDHQRQNIGVTPPWLAFTKIETVPKRFSSPTLKPREYEPALSFKVRRDYPIQPQQLTPVPMLVQGDEADLAYIGRRAQLRRRRRPLWMRLARQRAHFPPEYSQ